MVSNDKIASKGTYNLEDLNEIMTILRGKEGCPWDREQTHKTLMEPLLEESYEVLNAIKNEDIENLCEELGDLLLQVIFHAKIAEENNEFTIDNVIDQLAKKLINRHPHVFGETTVNNSEEVKENWEEIKKVEKNYKSYTQSLEHVPETLPALMRAYKVQKKASKVGFDWKNIKGALEKVKEEYIELEKEYINGNKKGIEEEYGDLLFSIVNIARFFKLNPEFALTNAVEKFINRFRYIECFANESGRSLDKLTLKEMNVLWVKAKDCTKE